MSKVISGFALAILLTIPSHADIVSETKVINLGKYNLILETVNLEKFPISENNLRKALALAETTLSISDSYISPDIRIVVHNNDAIALYSYVYGFVAYYCRESLPSPDVIACPTRRTIHISSPVVEQSVNLFKGQVADIYTAILAHELLHHMLFDLGISDTNIHHCLIYGGMEQKIFVKLGLSISSFDDFYATAHKECIKPATNSPQQTPPQALPTTK